MISTTKITEIYCTIDDFNKVFVPKWQKQMLGNGKHRIKPSKLSLSEVMTIQVMFHLSGFRNFKTFYIGYVCKHLTSWFPDMV